MTAGSMRLSESADLGIKHDQFIVNICVTFTKLRHRFSRFCVFVCSRHGI
jgi:hypothetical protein